MATEIQHIKAVSIEDKLGKMASGVKDKLKDGRTINAGSIVMGDVVATATVGESKLEVVHDFGGGTVVLNRTTGRYFRFDPEKMVNYAIERGLVDPELRFEEDKSA